MLKATLKSVLSRKLRLVLSGLSVVLGVMFVSGSFVLTDTLDRSFKSLFTTIYSDVDVQVALKPKVRDDDQDGGASGGTLTADDLKAVQSVEGVGSAAGDVVDSARAIGGNGKVITASGAPRLGTAWRDGGQEEFREGRAPQRDDEVAISAYLAKTGGFRVGEPISLITLEPKKTFTVAGVFGYPGNRDSLGGEFTTAFTEPAAQRLLLGQPGAYTGITVKAADGVPEDVLRQRIQQKLGDEYQVKTGAQLAKEQSDAVGEGLAFFNYVLLGFAGIALFVGIFIILNTCSIIVAQRTRELALLRAMGASRKQMIGSVVLEAVVIGLVASVVGLGAGIGVGASPANVFSAIGGGGVRLAGIAVPAGAVVSAFAVGVVVTVLAAVLPALRASRIAPVAAMREAATPDRPLTRPTVAGAALSAAAGAVLWYGFSEASLWSVMAGLLVGFVGVALLTPLISRPAVSVIGKLPAWSMPGTLGRRNSARNPRRTAITAAALMVGIALITGVSVILTSATTSITKVAEGQVKSDLIISGEAQGPGGDATFAPDRVDRLGELPGVDSAFGWYADRIMVDGKRQFAVAVTDVPVMQRQFGLESRSGTFTDLPAGQLALDDDMAATLNLEHGSTVTVQTAKGEPATYTVGLVFAKNNVLTNAVVLPESAAENFRVRQMGNAFVQVEPGADVAEVQRRVEPLFADNPEITVQDRSAFVRQQAAQLDTVLVMIQILLALASSSGGLRLDRFRQLHRLLQECSHDPRLGDGAHHLPPHEDLPLAVARRDAQVRFPGLTGTVDHTPHDGDPQRQGEALERGGDLLRQLVDVDLRPPARRARHDLQLARPKTQRRQDLRAHLDLLHRRRGQRHPDRVADALRQQHAERDRRLHRALHQRPGLGDAEVQRVVAGTGQLPVGGDHHHRVVVLHRDLEVGEPVLLEQRALPQRRLDQRVRRGLAVLAVQPLVQRAGVHPDPDRHARAARRTRDLAHLVVELPDVARVHPHRRAPGVDRGEHVPGLEVDVGHHRDRRLARDGGQRVGVVLRRHGDPHDLAAGGGQLGDLPQRRLDVGGGRGGHGLHGDRRVAADLDAADGQLAGRPASPHRRCQLQCGQLCSFSRFRTVVVMPAASSPCARRISARVPCGRKLGGSANVPARVGAPTTASACASRPPSAPVDVVSSTASTSRCDAAILTSAGSSGAIQRGSTTLTGTPCPASSSAASRHACAIGPTATSSPTASGSSRSTSHRPTRRSAGMSGPADDFG
ncbi:ABC-type antimicrobial peptide transport system permease subunit [Saccharothrix tamanrassetensis]|uniref:ABC-type antimicrobial peptide transport system permease subunit n=1 Tax=Saccharothrix tamanrassetensis TaxID=1051531 RepID=A0A841CKL2_9PSEU|nr:ABC-type antimicrobial peptide transport system permease subunit [Saccharothrix tamanrassetensis]